MGLLALFLVGIVALGAYAYRGDSELKGPEFDEPTVEATVNFGNTKPLYIPQGFTYDTDDTIEEMRRSNSPPGLQPTVRGPETYREEKFLG